MTDLIMAKKDHAAADHRFRMSSNPKEWDRLWLELETARRRLARACEEHYRGRQSQAPGILTGRLGT